MMKKYRIRQFFKINLFKTLYFNFRLLPFEQAIKFPVFIYHRVEIGKTNGKIIFAVPPRTGLVQIGFVVNDFVGNKQWGYVSIEGDLEIKGKVDFGIGSHLKIYKNAKFSVGNNFVSGASRFICEKLIVIGNNVRYAHECQTMDSNFHYIEDVNSKNVDSCNGKIIIGDACWIANRCTIQKGTVIPDSCIIGAYSVLNKDYTKSCPPYSLIAGIPAKLIKTGFRRIFDLEEEAKWDNIHGRISHQN